MRRIYRIKELAEILSLSESTIRRIEAKDKTFPLRIQMTYKSHGWRSDEIEEWIESKRQRKVVTSPSSISNDNSEANEHND